MDQYQEHPLRLRINGQDREFSVQSWVTLLDLLRERAELTGTKKGCDHGQCGACTVLLDGKRVNACLCGYCTPGQLCSAAGLIAEGEAKSIDDVRELMSGNVCRCGAYPQITQAVVQVMGLDGGKRAGEGEKPFTTGAVLA